MAVALRSNASPTASADARDAGRLFEVHSSRLLAFCTRELGSRSEAEDAVQTTFLYAYRALGRGVVPENEYAWLHTIAKNVCRWQRRTLARRGSLTTALDLDAFPAQLEDEVEIRELREELETALASIPESQRQAFVLREMHGLSSQEVASRLGMSSEATYALLTRARRSLARAVTASRRGSTLGLDFGGLLLKLKALLAGSTAKVVATTVAAGSVAIGGVAVERTVTDGSAGGQAPSSALETEAPSAVRTALGSGPPSTDASSRGTARPAAGLRPSTSPPSGGAGPLGGSAQVPPELAPVPPELPGPAVMDEPPAAAGGEPSVGTDPGAPAEPKPAEPAPPAELPATPDELPAPEDLTPPLLEDLPAVELPPAVEELVPPEVDETAEDVEDLVDDVLEPLPLPPLELPLP